MMKFGMKSAMLAKNAPFAVGLVVGLLSASAFATQITLVASAVARGEASLPAPGSGLLSALPAFASMFTIIGTAIYFGALVRAKNTLSAMAHVLIASSMASILWVAFAGDLALANPSPSWLASLSNLFTQEPVSVARLINALPLIALSASLLFGSVVERSRLSAVLLVSLIWTFAVAAPVLRSVQNGGLLASLGFADWVGAGSLHLAVGITSLGL